MWLIGFEEPIFIPPTFHDSASKEVPQLAHVAVSVTASPWQDEAGLMVTTALFSPTTTL